MTEHISRKMNGVAARLLKLDLQLFADDEFPGVTDEETDADSVDESEDITADDLDQPDHADDMRGDEDEPEVDKKTEVKPEKEKQDPETNKAFQKMRQEKEAAERKAAELESKRVRDIEVARKYGAEFGIYSDEDVAKQFGASHGITTVEQFEQQLQKEQYVRDGMSEKTADQLAKFDQYIKRQEEQEKKAQEEKQDRLLEDNYKELTSTYPELVKSPDDIGPEVWAKFNMGNSGLSLTQIYRAINHDTIMAKNSAAVKQKTVTNINSKKHLATEADGAGEETADISIDPQTMEMYRGMGMNKAQAVKHHKKLYG